MTRTDLPHSQYAAVIPEFPQAEPAAFRVSKVRRPKLLRFRRAPNSTSTNYLHRPFQIDSTQRPSCTARILENDLIPLPRCLIEGCSTASCLQYLHGGHNTLCDTFRSDTRSKAVICLCICLDPFSSPAQHTERVSHQLSACRHLLQILLATIEPSSTP